MTGTLRCLGVGAALLLSAGACDTQSAEPAEVVIAAFYPLSGDQAETGADLRRGVELADAIDRAGSTEAERIRDALLATELDAGELVVPWDGVRFDPATGQNVLAKGNVVQIRYGAYRTVWPPELATVELVWPMGPWAE